jgi:hypothetical protein
MRAARLLLTAPCSRAPALAAQPRPCPRPRQLAARLLLPRVRVHQLLVFLPWLCRGGGKNEDFGPYAQVGILDVWAMPRSFSFLFKKAS